MSNTEIPPPSRVVADPIYGQVKIPEVLNLLIDQPFFQRLRNIKQLGLTYFVYPSACHDRFQHSIGTFHLARLWLESLKSYKEINDRLTRKDEYCVYIAALYHDIGHGPFSHFWDGIFIKKERSLRREKTIDHEEMSIKILRHIFNENKENLENYGLGTLELRKIESMIMGKEIDKYIKSLPKKYQIYLPEEEKDKGFLYMIISNHEAEIDVDKWDYLLRDGFFSFGSSLQIPVHRFYESVFFRKNKDKWEMVIRYKDYLNMSMIFLHRHRMHRQVYQHKTCQAIEQMVYDAIHKSDKCEDYYQWSTEKDLKKFLSLNDGILWQLLDEEDEESKTHQIIQRIFHRQLYKMITFASFAMEDFDKLKSTENQTIYDYATLIEDKIKKSSKISKKKFFIRVAKFDYAGPANNPMNKLVVVNKKGKTVPAEDMSDMIKLNSKPEYELRFFIRETNVDIQKLIDNFKENFLSISREKSVKFRFMIF